jgi:hypothetical protein
MRLRIIRPSWSIKIILLYSAEVFLLWVIEGGEELKKKIPF